MYQAPIYLNLIQALYTRLESKTHVTVIFVVLIGAAARHNLFTRSLYTSRTFGARWVNSIGTSKFGGM